MLYSSGASGVFQSAKLILEGSPSVLASRKVETSDPKELNEAYLRAELGHEGSSGNPSGAATPVERIEEKKPFAKPKGPGRRR